MAHSFEIRQEACKLRRDGYSYREITATIGVGKGTAYQWTMHVELNEKAQDRLHNVMSLAQIKSTESNQERRVERDAIIEEDINKVMSQIVPTKLLFKVLTATLYWAEGGKSLPGRVQFVNSDPQMIKTYLHTLRNGFCIDESKLRCLVHIHEYHDESATKEFWSKVTKIPLSQFNKSYLKPHTGKRTRDGYKGCVHIVYCDIKIATEIRMIYNKLPYALGV